MIKPILFFSSALVHLNHFPLIFLLHEENIGKLRNGVVSKTEEF